MLWAGTRFYIAASLSQRSVVQELGDTLIQRGAVWTYDWTRRGTAAADSRDKWAEIAETEIAGVAEAEYVFVLVSPEAAGRGTHCELGAALALNKRVVLLAKDEASLTRDGYACVFHAHPRVRVVHCDTTASTALAAALDAACAAEEGARMAAATLPLHTVLLTRDGRKVGNAIVVKVSDAGLHTVRTDYGNDGGDLSREEIDALWYVGEVNPSHKHAVRVAGALLSGEKACTGGPIAWRRERGEFVCYLCERAWTACPGLGGAEGRGARLHAMCENAEPRVAVGREAQARLRCSVCKEPWAPFPRHNEADACDRAASAAVGAATRAGLSDPQRAPEVLQRARVAACTSFGGFVHGDEGCGCWRCGEPRQAHRSA